MTVSYGATNLTPSKSLGSTKMYISKADGFWHCMLCTEEASLFMSSAIPNIDIGIEGRISELPQP